MISKNTIRSWWHTMGNKSYRKASKLMITADCGGSNGNRVKLWKKGLNPNLDEYRGAFKDGLRHGQGVYISRKRHGTGTFTDAVGHVSRGEWKDDRFIG